MRRTSLHGFSTVTHGSADPGDRLQPVAKISWSPLGAGTVADTIWMNRKPCSQIVHFGPPLCGENVISPGTSG